MDLPVFAGFLVSAVPLLSITQPGSTVIEIYISVVSCFWICVLPKKGSQLSTFGCALRSKFIKDVSLGYQQLVVVIDSLVEIVGIADGRIRMASD